MRTAAVGATRGGLPRILRRRRGCQDRVDSGGSRTASSCRDKGCAMKTVSVEEFRSHLDDLLAEVARQDLLLVRDGKPFVLLHCVTGEETHVQELDDTEFWKMIHERRDEHAIPWDDAKAQLGSA